MDGRINQRRNLYGINPAGDCCDCGLEGCRGGRCGSHDGRKVGGLDFPTSLKTP